MTKKHANRAPARLTNKRNFLKIMGGGVILAAAGAGTFLATRTPYKAIEPWKLALGPQTRTDPRHIVLSHAILAPNPHNRQPWMVDLSADNEITLYCDLDRRLPETDPYDRQITIGLGCFLELLNLAAGQAGYDADIRLFPEGAGQPRLNEKPVAHIRLTESPGVQADPLFAQIPYRRSNKDVFDVTKGVSPERAGQILSAGAHGTRPGHVLAPERVEKLREITWSALEKEIRTYRTSKESVDLMRVGKAEIEANPDGIDLGGAFFESLSLVGMLDPQGMLDPDSNMFQQSVAALKPSLDTAMGYVFIKTAGNSRADQIAAGRDYARLNLKATELGIAMHPLSQALQEYEEVASHSAAIRKELGVDENEILQMFARIGYGDKPEPSPRWGHESKIRNAG